MCGLEHRVVDSVALKDPGAIRYDDSDDIQLGTVYLLRKPSGAACVVTIKAIALDRKTHTRAYVQRAGGPRHNGVVRFTYAKVVGGGQRIYGWVMRGYRLTGHRSTGTLR